MEQEQKKQLISELKLLKEEMESVPQVEAEVFQNQNYQNAVVFLRGCLEKAGLFFRNQSPTLTLDPITTLEMYAEKDCMHLCNFISREILKLEKSTENE